MFRTEELVLYRVKIPYLAGGDRGEEKISTSETGSRGDVSFRRDFGVQLDNLR